MKDREILFFTGSSGLLLTIWEDSKKVLLVSNFHKPEKTMTERRIRKKDLRPDTKRNEKEEVVIPKSIADYTSYMGGVDHFDQI